METIGRNESTSRSQVHQLQVREQISNIEAATERLATVITNLEDRLGDLLRPVEQKEGAPEKAPVLVPMAINLNKFYVELEISASRIADIMNRLEI